MSAAMESLRARQIARRAARSSPSIAKPAAPCSAPVRASVPWVSPARRCRLDARIATLSGAQSRQGVSCRSTRAAADDGVVDIDADVIDDRVPITVRSPAVFCVAPCIPARLPPTVRAPLLEMAKTPLHQPRYAGVAQRA